MSLSITLAKANIVNPIILDNAEVSYILENGMVPLSINNLLKASDVSIYESNNTIYYTIKLPQLSENVIL